MFYYSEISKSEQWFVLRVEWNCPGFNSRWYIIYKHVLYFAEIDKSLECKVMSVSNILDIEQIYCVNSGHLFSTIKPS